MLVYTILYKSFAVAEMGDHATAKWAEKWGAAMPRSVGELHPRRVWDDFENRS